MLPALLVRCFAGQMLPWSDVLLVMMNEECVNHLCMIYFNVVQEDRCGTMLAHYGHLLALGGGVP
jgi:hypothetical protein